MDNWPERIVRKAILGLVPYSSRGGVTSALHLDANESPFTPPPSLSLNKYNRYPDQQPLSLLERLSTLYTTDKKNIMLGRGADEGIEVLLRTFCESNKDNILICSPYFWLLRYMRSNSRSRNNRRTAYSQILNGKMKK